MARHNSSSSFVFKQKQQQQQQALTPATLGSDAGFELNSGEYACGQERVSQMWLDRKDVQAALHVKLVGKTNFSFSTGLNYTFTAGSLLHEYKERLIPAYRIMQYSGDADPCVPYVGTQRWIDSLGLEIEMAWRPWTAGGPHDSGMVAGYTQTYAANNFSFVTVRDAGHMVPRYKPEQTLHMISSFLRQMPL
eukprot:UC1_evm4s195